MCPNPPCTVSVADVSTTLGNSSNRSSASNSETSIGVACKCVVTLPCRPPRRSSQNTVLRSSASSKLQLIANIRRAFPQRRSLIRAAHFFQFAFQQVQPVQQAKIYISLRLQKLFAIPKLHSTFAACTARQHAKEHSRPLPH